MKTPRLVPLVSKLESVDGHSVWIMSMTQAERIVRCHPLQDSGLPQPITRAPVGQPK